MGSVYAVTRKSALSLWTSLLGAGINIVLNALLIPSPLGIQGAAVATCASYFAVFLVRTVSARRLIPFPLSGRTLFPGIAVLAVQILFVTFEWRAWQWVQIGAVIGMLLIGRKQIVEKLSVLRRKMRRLR